MRKGKLELSRKGSQIEATLYDMTVGQGTIVSGTIETVFFDDGTYANLWFSTTGLKEYSEISKVIRKLWKRGGTLLFQEPHGDCIRYKIESKDVHLKSEVKTVSMTLPITTTIDISWELSEGSPSRAVGIGNPRSPDLTVEDINDRLARDPKFRELVEESLKCS